MAFDTAKHLAVTACTFCPYIIYIPMNFHKECSSYIRRTLVLGTIIDQKTEIEYSIHPRGINRATKMKIGATIILLMALIFQVSTARSYWPRTEKCKQ